MTTLKYLPLGDAIIFVQHISHIVKYNIKHTQTYFVRVHFANSTDVIDHHFTNEEDLNIGFKSIQTLITELL